MNDSEFKSYFSSLINNEENNDSPRKLVKPLGCFKRAELQLLKYDSVSKSFI